MKLKSILLIVFIYSFSLYGQRKDKTETFISSVTYKGGTFTGQYSGNVEKVKINGEKTLQPFGVGTFKGYPKLSKPISTKKLVDVVFLPKVLKDGMLKTFDFENEEMFSIETSTSINRQHRNYIENDSDDGGGVSFILNFNNVKTDYLKISLLVFKRPENITIISDVEKEIYNKQKNTFKNIIIEGVIDGNKIQNEFRIEEKILEKWMKIEFIKDGFGIDIIINNLKCNLFLGEGLSLTNFKMLKDKNVESVAFEYLKVDRIKYKEEERFEYTGNWEDGLFNGEGELRINNGHFKGAFTLGVLNGPGVYDSLNYKYTGNFLDGVATGKGKIISELFEYAGEVKNCKPNGKGEIYFKNQANDGNIHSHYIGSFINGDISGIGQMKYSNGDTLNGHWEGFSFSGIGKRMFGYGSSYEGEWKNGKKNGKGAFINSDGFLLNGEFNNDLFTGLGKIKIDKNKIFKGNIIDDKPFGSGILFYPNGDSLVGAYDEKGFKGKGKIRFDKIEKETDNYFYAEGNWEYGALNGYGVQVVKLNNVHGIRIIATYEGNHKNHVIDGEGVLSYSNDSLNYRIEANHKNGIAIFGKVEIVSISNSNSFIRYEGQLSDYETFNGQGTLTVRNKSEKYSYTGEISNGIINGKGKLTDDFNKFEYSGDFLNGLPHGIGIKIFENNKTESGTFRNGDYIPTYECKTAIIGNQVWMVENLNVSKFNNGDLIHEVRGQEEWVLAAKNKTPAWCYLNNDVKNGVKYGKLYNFYAVIDPRGIAPEGWRIPSAHDWDNLFYFLEKGYFDVESKIKDLESQGIYSGDKYSNLIKKRSEINTSNNRTSYKLRSKYGWQNKPGGDVFGFNALQSGHRTYSEFWTMLTYYWSLGYDNNNNGLRFYLGANDALPIDSRFVDNDFYTCGLSELEDGYSIRCIKIK